MKPQNREDEPKQRAGQGETRIDRLKNHIKRGEQNDAPEAVGDGACNRDAKLRLVREMLRAVATASPETTSGSSRA